ncbi:MAG: VWA domain-containing protein [Bacillota bacterium]|nr:VWA domain-containing protein [Bacillota bacterium]
MVPFLGILGNERAKRALLLLCIDPAIGSLLILGEGGSGKTRLVSSLESLGVRLTRCPAGVSEEQLYTQIDLERTVATGHLEGEKGLLERADGNLLFVDEVGRMNRKTLQIIVESGKFFYDPRRGLRAYRPLRYGVLATMNWQETQEPESVLDFFSMIVSTERLEDMETRCRIIESELRFERCPEAESKHYQAEHSVLRDRIDRAKRLVGEVYLSFPHKVKIVEEFNSRSIRGNHLESAVYRIACANAAWNERRLVYEEDVRVALDLALGLRGVLTSPSSPPPSAPPLSSAPPHQKNPPAKEPPTQGENSSADAGAENPSSSQDSLQGDGSQEREDEVFAVGEETLPTFAEQRKRWKTDFLGVGRKEKAITKDMSGRKVRTELSKDVRDIDLFGTLMQAAPYQAQRRNGETTGGMILRKSDLRRKVRERGVGHHVVILIDSSGSLAVNRRMNAVKGAVFELLKRSYVRRDHVALLAFRRDRAEILLPLTRSLTLAKKKLEHLPTGGNTPLSLGLERLADYVRSVKVKQPQAIFRIFIISDGRANRSIGESGPVEEAKHQASRLKMQGVRVHFLDYERSRFPLEVMRDLAEIAAGSYIKMDEVSESEIIAAMRRKE